MFSVFVGLCLPHPLAPPVSRIKLVARSLACGIGSRTFSLGKSAASATVSESSPPPFPFCLVSGSPLPLLTQIAWELLFFLSLPVPGFRPSGVSVLFLFLLPESLRDVTLNTGVCWVTPFFAGQSVSAYCGGGESFLEAQHCKYRSGEQPGENSIHLKGFGRDPATGEDFVHHTEVRRAVKTHIEHSWIENTVHAQRRPDQIHWSASLWWRALEFSWL